MQFIRISEYAKKNDYMRLWGSICVALALLGSNEPIGSVINHLFVLFFNSLGINCLPKVFFGFAFFHK